MRRLPNALEFEYASSCVSSEWKEGALLIQPDALGEGGSNGGARSLQPLGLFARPDDPENNVGAGALVARDGDEAFILPLTDPRGIGTVPNGPKGSVTLYAPKNSLTSYFHIDGGSEEGKAFAQWLMKYGNEGKSHSITFDAEAAEPAVTCRHGEGHGWVLTNDKKLLLESANGQNRIEISDSGILIVGPLQCEGGVSTGGAGGLPVLTTSDMDALKASLQVYFSGLLCAAPGSAVVGTATVPFVAVTPGSTKLSAAT